MAIAFDAVSSGETTSSSVTFAHTITGSDTYLTVGVHFDDQSITATVTFNGVSMDQLALVRNTVNATTYLFGLVAPASGTHNIVVTLSGASFITLVTAVSFTGVDQSTPVGTAATNVGFSAPITVDVSSADDELVVDHAGQVSHPATPNVGAGQTARLNFDSVTAGRNFHAFSSTEPGAGTVTMSWEDLPNEGWTTATVPLKPAADAPTGWGQLFSNSRNRLVVVQ